MSSAFNGLSIDVNDRATLYIPTLFPINWISIYVNPYWHTGGMPIISAVGISESAVVIPDPSGYRTHAYLYPEDDPSVVKQRWIIELQNKRSGSPIVMTQIHVAAFGLAK